MWDCLSDSQSCLFFGVQIEDTKIFLNENPSASSGVFKASFAFLTEVLSRFVKLDIRHQKSIILIQLSQYLAYC